MRRHHIYLIVWALFLIALSFIPGRIAQVQKFQADKILHLLAFAYLGYLAARAFGWWGLIAVLAFGALNEVQQFVAPGRDVGIIDFAANELGSAAGFVIGIIRRKRALSTG